MAESCGICGGDGRFSNSFGNETRCPGCHGTGRRQEDNVGRDVTTMASPRGAQARGGAVPAPRETGPSTHEGLVLAKEVQASMLSIDGKAKLVLEIAAYEAQKGTITQTYAKKLRRQLRPPMA